MWKLSFPKTSPENPSCSSQSLMFKVFNKNIQPKSKLLIVENLRDWPYTHGV